MSSLRKAINFFPDISRKHPRNDIYLMLLEAYFIVCLPMHILSFAGKRNHRSELKLFIMTTVIASILYMIFVIPERFISVSTSSLASFLAKHQIWHSTAVDLFPVISTIGVSGVYLLLQMLNSVYSCTKHKTQHQRNRAAVEDDFEEETSESDIRRRNEMQRAIRMRIEMNQKREEEARKRQATARNKETYPRYQSAQRNSPSFTTFSPRPFGWPANEETEANKTKFI
ncbi:uncharacterized protein MONOS_166 [Monocercomonoides exilis]|uniref:uncharacterized protein n=1 Tax=Monocercomonoides exilis TaxID=2049356 RepID=UPI003559CC19|nr:hypothetical protein MONOS_166 [Monocercomonoides exilis]|eukprot:MONOS_166.1-p1 / transcript=MONOS_166.1 / gene=MONOS_166 / organism=Monocercomonoides_exilis_PA203 / gene_product=unspecified product / transcript_product=unspecified product / location=Mono_scaffold00003:81967-82911(-) / protein_length=228 / sequence_SO=supercontig / SO=protein_coding / is_pseudo=false